jgi:HAD superfamily hydrolase (TIGR01509 family)
VPPAKVRAIIFDIGRVLVHVDAARAVEHLAPGRSLSPEEAWASLQKDPRWPDWQEGRISPRDWYLHVSKRLGTSLAFDQFTKAWNAALDPDPIQDNTFLEQLSKRYRLALLSNTDPIHVAHMEATYDFFRFFPARIYSCQIGVSKPNPLIYREALRACKVGAEEALYIDDVPAYVEAAQRLGMSGIAFQSPEQLATDLRAHGLILD